MGIVIAKFRKKPSTYDVLTKLENEIVSIEEFQKRTQQAQRKIVFRFIFLALLIYVALALLLYFYFSQISQNQKLFWSIPLIAFPFVIWFIKKFLTWYYNRKIGKNEKKLVTLKEKKKEILENVMETETYKIAKQILDKFGNEPKKLVVSTPTVQKSSPMVTTRRQLYDTGLRQRNVAAQNAMRTRISFGGPPESPRPIQQQMALPTPGQLRSFNVLRTPNQLAITSVPASLPRSILPRDRSVLDKMVDYLVGDGPSNRYALICQKCSSHNGMALKEEFEYISFRCCYCSHFNPARKKKPSGPKFDSPRSPARLPSPPNESSDSEKNSENDSDSDTVFEKSGSYSPDIVNISNVGNITESRVEETRSDSLDIVNISNAENISETELPTEDTKMEVEEHDVQQDTANITDLGENGDTVGTSRDVSDN